MTDHIAYIVVWTFASLGFLFTIQTIYPPKKIVVSFLFILVTICAPVMLYTPVVDSLGYSVESEDASTAKMIDYTVDSEQKWIHIWVYNVEVDEPRSYKIPYTKEDEEKLSAGKKKGEEGVPQQVTIPGSQKASRQDQAGGKLEIEDLPDGGRRK